MAAAQNATIEQKVVAMVTHTNQVIKEASAVVTENEKTAAAVASAIPACIKALLDHERINPQDAEKFAAALRNPVKVIELLTKVAAHKNTAEANSLGQPVEGDGQKKASAAPVAPGTRQRREAPLRESDANFFKNLGLPVPTH